MHDQAVKAPQDAPISDTDRSLIARLPITLRPALNQQFSEWGTLFPFEQNRVGDFLRGVATFSPTALDALVAKLRLLETKMGVQHWYFTESSETIKNASQLASSEYYAAWRKEVDRVFEAINAAGRDSAPGQAASTRLIVLFLPSNLPVDPNFIKDFLGPGGQEIKTSGDPGKLCELAMQGSSDFPAIPSLVAREKGFDCSDLWLIDAEGKLTEMLSPQFATAVSSLSYFALKPFRDRFRAELNTAPKNIRATDELVANLRLESWNGWGLWPAAIASQPRMRRFLIDLFLSGNGAFIFSNAFVEWAASEALRRARPRTIVARFGMRSKPKPFSSIAVFENQQRISSLPEVDDPENSAIDAAILARYVWLSVARYPEHEQTICLCVCESRNSAYVIPPAGKSLKWRPGSTVAPEELYGWVGEQFLSR